MQVLSSQLSDIYEDTNMHEAHHTKFAHSPSSLSSGPSMYLLHDYKPRKSTSNIQSLLSNTMTHGMSETWNYALDNTLEITFFQCHTY